MPNQIWSSLGTTVKTEAQCLFAYQGLELRGLMLQQHSQQRSQLVLVETVSMITCLKQYLVCSTSCASIHLISQVGSAAIGPILFLKFSSCPYDQVTSNNRAMRFSLHPGTCQRERAHAHAWSYGHLAKFLRSTVELLCNCGHWFFINFFHLHLGQVFASFDYCQKADIYSLFCSIAQTHVS